jgi:2-oxoglutarate dehydrogenase E2 component (dihydrolipoamide succinyltransferase)
VLKTILRQQGETVAIGDPLADIDDAARPATAPGGTKSDNKSDNTSDTKGQAKSEMPSDRKGAVRGSVGGKSKNGGAPVAASGSGAGGSPELTAANGAAAEGSALRAPPSARRAMAESGLTADEVTGTGRGGRIQPLDVSRALEARQGGQPGQGGQGGGQAGNGGSGSAVVARGPGATAPGAPPWSPEEGTRERTVPMTPLRKTIARRLVEAQHTAAILTTFNEIDMTAVLAMRERYQDRFTKQHGIKLGFMGFFVKAAIEGLKAFPSVNAEVRGTDVIYKDHYDIGVAVGGGKGLVVPVIRDADRLSFAEVEKGISALAAKAKDNKLQLAELEGGTFTISNGGIYGSMMSTPILNPPQSGILGLHNIQKRAMVVDDQLVIRPMMYVALSYDHRIVDGREAVQFLVRVKDCVETPERILLEI